MAGTDFGHENRLFLPVFLPISVLVIDIPPQLNFLPSIKKEPIIR